MVLLYILYLHVYPQVFDIRQCMSSWIIDLNYHGITIYFISTCIPAGIRHSTVPCLVELLIWIIMVLLYILYLHVYPQVFDIWQCHVWLNYWFELSWFYYIFFIYMYIRRYSTFDSAKSSWIIDLNYHGFTIYFISTCIPAGIRHSTVPSSDAATGCDSPGSSRCPSSSGGGNRSWTGVCRWYSSSCW